MLGHTASGENRDFKATSLPSVSAENVRTSLHVGPVPGKCYSYNEGKLAISLTLPQLVAE